MPWRPVKFRDNRVLARCDEQGALVAEGGRVEIRYRPNDGRAYRAALRNLEVIEGESLLPDDACADVAPAAASKRAEVVVHEDPADTIIAYTDGACSGNPGPAGLGVVLIDGDRCRELSEFLGQGTNNIAELAAIGRAAHAVEAVDRPVRIHTDSRYAIGVLTKGHKAKKNRELVAEVKAFLARLSDVELRYVPGHSGIALNERADALAVEAVERRESTGWTSG